MNPPRNMLSRDLGQQPMQEAPPMNMLGRGYGQQQPPVHMASDRGQSQGQPSQQDLDEAWERMPNDSTGEAIEQAVRQSGGALVAPWGREPAPGSLDAHVRHLYEMFRPRDADEPSRGGSGAQQMPGRMNFGGEPNMVRGAGLRNDGLMDQISEEHSNRPLADWYNYRQDPMYGDPGRWSSQDPARRAVGDVMARRHELGKRR